MRTPSESTLRLLYTEKVYEEVLNKIRERIGDSYIWLSIDETTDAAGRMVANVVVGALDVDSTAFLLHTEFMERTCSAAIGKVVDVALSVLWPGGVHYDRVLLFVTDAAPYMVKAGKALREALLPKMVHVTCIVHAIHRVCEVIRKSYPHTDKLIATVKSIFLKAPRRVQLFKERLPDLPLPPEPVLTRWGTWLKAAHYYSQHLEQVRVRNFMCI